MKSKTRIAGICTALTLIAAMALGGCNGEPAQQGESEAGGTTTSATSTSSTTTPTSTSATTTTTTEPTTSPTSNESSSNSEDITKEQAIEITKDVFDRTGSIYYMILTYPSLLEADETQTIPGEPDYWLVTDERFQTMADLKAYTETAYTPNYIDKNFSYIFNADQECNFKEYNGRLYADSRVGGVGNLAEIAWDSLCIISQSEDSLIVKVNETINDRVCDVLTYIMKKEESNWRLDDESIEIIEPEE